MGKSMEDVKKISISMLRSLAKRRLIKWTTHCAARIQERGILRTEILCGIENGEIIEQYPEDFPYPSCLILGLEKLNKPLHIVVGCDKAFIYIITAYYPDNMKWEGGFKTRKEPK